MTDSVRKITLERTSVEVHPEDARHKGLIEHGADIIYIIEKDLYLGESFWKDSVGTVYMSHEVFDTIAEAQKALEDGQYVPPIGVEFSHADEVDSIRSARLTARL